MQPQLSNDYDFIMDPGKPPRQSMLPGLPGGSGNPIIKRVGVVLGIVIVIIILFVVGSSLLGGSGNTPKLTLVAEQQNELIRVATLATTIGAQQSSQPNLDFTQSCLLSITSAQQALVSFLGQNGVKLSTKTLALAQNSQTDTTLNTAVAASTFNAAYSTVMQNQLGLYKTSLQNAYKTAGNTTEKQLLLSDYTGAQLLLQELTSPTQ